MTLGHHRLRSRALAAVILAAPLARSHIAHGFCGFYVSGSTEQLTNRATRVALMREGTRTVLTMSNDYEGPPQDFAMVVPVPVVLQQENVRTLPHDVFSHLEALTAPRLVEYWEQDPCYRPPPPRPPMAPMAALAAPGRRSGAEPIGELGVRIEARFSVGEYQVLVLSATQSSGLETWLRQNRYNIPAGAAEYLAPYVRDGSKFFVARVDMQRVERRPNGGARLSPLRFHYDSPEFRLPVRLGLLNAPAQQDLLVYVIHPSARFEVANYRNVFIPTNLDVTDEARANFGPFYAQLFDQTLASAGGRAVVTEYVWSTNNCDPCPSPPLNPSDLATLGADVLVGSSYHGGVMSVTRMHTRYNRATLTEDLVFREAPPVVGGREMSTDANGGIEHGAQVQPAGSSSSFQARYAIRHPWTGPIACNNPRRNVWGGPPAGTPPPAPQAARDLADAPRGRIALASVVRTPVPELGLVPAGRAATPGAPLRPVRVRVPGSLPKEQPAASEKDSAHAPWWHRAAGVAGAAAAALGAAFSLRGRRRT